MNYFIFICEIIKNDYIAISILNENGNCLNSIISIYTMLYARRGFSAFDMFSVNATLKAGSKTKIKSGSSGIISFLLIGVFLYLIISNCLEIIQYKRIDFS